MNRRDEEDRVFSDLWYDAWRDGYNPDNVSRERFDYRCAMGADPEQISYRSCMPRYGAPKEEQEFAEPEYPDQEIPRV